MREITEKNVPEWMLRLQILEGFGLAPLYDFQSKGHRIFTWEELHRNIGLKTNVGQETRAQFIKRQVKHQMQENETKWRQYLERTNSDSGES